MRWWGCTLWTVGLCVKDALTGESFPLSRLWLALGGAASLGSEAKCQCIKKTENMLDKTLHLLRFIENKFWQGCEMFWHCWWECKMVQRLWKPVWQFLSQFNIELTCDSAISLLDIHKNQLKVGTQMFVAHFIAALLTISKKWKQLKCSTDRWMGKQTWYMQSTDYYSVLKRNKIFIHATTWMT